jgi:hypothetical protein
METINPHACREGFEQQREAGINVDWFTWQIAWHDAMFTQVDTKPASQPKALTDTMLEKLYWTAMNNAADILKFMDEGRALLEAK